MIEPEFDEGGYPTDETIAEIEARPIMGASDCLDLLDFVRQAWTYPEYFQVTSEPNNDTLLEPEGEWFYVSTGGWSGNEDLVGALQANRSFWALCWWQIRRGGHYIFFVPK